MKAIKVLLFLIALSTICGGLAWSFFKQGRDTQHSKSGTAKVYIDTTSASIYYLQHRKFTYKVSINDSITDTISLVTYPRVVLDGQGLVVWCYPNARREKERHTGVIENDSVIWLHPPRDYNLDVLTIVAFPTMKKPFAVGTKWDWHLDVTDAWTPTRLKSKKWIGLLSCEFTYEVTSKEIHQVLNMQVSCYTIETISRSKMGITYGYHVFNSQYGFTELYYPDIFGIKLKVELISFVEIAPLKKYFTMDEFVKK